MPPGRSPVSPEGKTYQFQPEKKLPANWGEAFKRLKDANTKSGLTWDELKQLPFRERILFLQRFPDLAPERPVSEYSMQRRLELALIYTGRHLPAEAREQFNQLFNARNIALTSGLVFPL